MQADSAAAYVEKIENALNAELAALKDVLANQLKMITDLQEKTKAQWIEGNPTCVGWWVVVDSQDNFGVVFVSSRRELHYTSGKYNVQAHILEMDFRRSFGPISDGRMFR